jgi:hypothetical protein
MDRVRAALTAVLALACAPGERAAAPPAIEFAGIPGSSAPNLARAADGTAVLTWLEPVEGRRHALRVARRAEGRWSAPRTIAESDSFFVNWADFPSLVGLGDGAWIAHWLARVPGGVYAYHVRLAVSRDQGATWSPPIVAHADASAQEHGFVALVPWDDTTAAALWLDGREMRLADAAAEAEGDMTLRFRTVTSSGTLGPEALLDARTCECCQTALARTATGLVAAYRDRSPEEIRDIHVVRYAGGQWTAGTTRGVPSTVRRSPRRATRWRSPGTRRPATRRACSRRSRRTGAPAGERRSASMTAGRWDAWTSSWRAMARSSAGSSRGRDRPRCGPAGSGDAAGRSARGA